MVMNCRSLRFSKNMPAEKALRPIPTHYVPASFNALLKLETPDTSVPRDCKASDVFFNPAVRVAVFRGASGSGKTMGALHATDGHLTIHPQSTVLGALHPHASAARRYIRLVEHCGYHRKGGN